MRIIIAGGGYLGQIIANQLIAEGHDVVVIEKDKDRASKLAGELDCSVIAGDAAFPNILKSAGAENADYVIAATGSDKDNLIIGVVARNLGVKNVIVMLNDIQFESIALSLGLYHIIAPARLSALQAISMIKGMDIANLSMIIKGDARFYLGVAGESVDGLKVSELKIPGESMIVAVYRGETFLLPKGDLVIKKGDEILVITREDKLDKVREFFGK